MDENSRVENLSTFAFYKIFNREQEKKGGKISSLPTERNVSVSVFSSSPSSSFFQTEEQ